MPVGQDGLVVSTAKQHLHPNLRLDEIETADSDTLALFSRILETGKLKDMQAHSSLFLLIIIRPNPRLQKNACITLY